MKTMFKKISAYFIGEQNLEKIYNDEYNLNLLKEAHADIIPGIISRTVYFAGEWLLYILAFVCFFIAYYIWDGPFDHLLYRLMEDRVKTSTTITKDMMDYFYWASLLLFSLPALFFFLMARLSRAKSIQLKKLATVGKKIDEVSKNLAYRIEHKNNPVN